MSIVADRIREQATALLNRLPAPNLSKSTTKVYDATWRRMLAEEILDPLRVGDARDTYNGRRAALLAGTWRQLRFQLTALKQAAERGDRDAAESALSVLARVVERCGPAIERDPPKPMTSSDWTAQPSRWAASGVPHPRRGKGSKKHILGSLPADWMMRVWNAADGDWALSLVHRLPTGYRLTEMAERLLPAVAEVEGRISNLQGAILGLASELAGVVRLTCPEPVLSRLVASGFVDRFHTRYPGLRIDFVISDRYVDLAGGAADVAFRSGDPGDDRLVGRKIADSTWAVYASRDYIERHGQPRSTEELLQHDLVGFDGAMTNHRVSQWLASALPGVRIVARNNSVLGVISAVKSGLGVAPLPTTIADPEPDLVQVLPPVPDLARSWYVLCAPEQRSTPRIAAFIDFVVGEIPVVRKVLGG